MNKTLVLDIIRSKAVLGGYEESKLKVDCQQSQSRLVVESEEARLDTDLDTGKTSFFIVEALGYIKVRDSKNTTAS